MRGYYQTLKSNAEAEQRDRARAYARAVAKAGFLSPTSPLDVIAAAVAHEKSWIYPVTVDGVSGYRSNLTVAELTP